MKNSRKGFTLIEMLVVIAIIAVLVAIIVPVVIGSTHKAKGAADAANLRSIQGEAATDYLEDNKINKGPYEITLKTSNEKCAVVFYEVQGNLVALVNAGTKEAPVFHDVNYFAAIAEGNEGAAYELPANSTELIDESPKTEAPTE